jgi:hypothetical protein
LAVRWSTLSGLLVGADAVPGSIATLAQGVINAMLIQTVKVCGLATILAVGAVGTLVVAQQEKAGQNSPANRQVGAAASPPEQKAASTPVLTKVETPRPERERITQQILRKLDEEVELDLPEKASLGAVLKAIKKVTTDTTFTGIPIYVEPFGLEEVGRQRNIHPDSKLLDFVVDLKGIRVGKVRDLLHRALRQYQLS